MGLPSKGAHVLIPRTREYFWLQGKRGVKIADGIKVFHPLTPHVRRGSWVIQVGPT